MLRRSLLILIVFFTLTGYVASAQPVEIDSLLIRRDVPSFPYQAALDSVRQAYLHRQPRDPFDTIPIEEPRFYAMSLAGDTITLRTFMAEASCSLPGELRCIITLRVAWNGTISEIRLRRCWQAELLPEADYRSLLIRLRARAGRYGGVPYDYPKWYGFRIPMHKCKDT